MVMPPLLNLADEAAYRGHFERSCCGGNIATHDGIRVYFRRQDFDHAFFESSGRRGENDVFSLVRAQRMDWIVAALADPAAACFQGWDRKNKRYDARRRVAVVMQDFVVVISLSMRRDGSLKANFVTCYRAENSIVKIRQSPRWTLRDFHNEFR
jgi:hypothetical protein